MQIDALTTFRHFVSRCAERHETTLGFHLHANAHESEDADAEKDKEDGENAVTDKLLKTIQSLKSENRELKTDLE